MEVIIHYDTISFEFRAECSDSTIKSNLEQEIKDNQGQRITDWFEKFIKKATESITKRK